MKTRRVFLYFVSSGAAAALGACTSEPGTPSEDSESAGDGDSGDNTGDDSPTGDGDVSTSGDGDASGDGDSSGDTDTNGDGDGEACDDPFEGGDLLGVVPFIGETGTVGVKTGAGTGHDARLSTDLTTISADALITSNDQFYIRTEFPDQIDEGATWTVNVGGLVGSDLSITIDELLAMEHVTEVVCMECSGNSGGRRFGLMSAAEFSGVPLMDVLDMVDIDPSATMVMVSGFDEHSFNSSASTPGASWAFTFEDIANAGGMLATQMNGEPLPRDHGQPVRLLMPGWYGCCSAKWVDEIRLVDDSEPSSSQMQEYAARTHQSGVPALAKDFVPATMDQSAMLTRVEKWMVDGEIKYKLVGIMWGGYETTDKLVMEVDGDTGVAIDVCPAQTQNRTWTLWTAAFSPAQTGQYAFGMQIDNPAIDTNRLDSGYYTRAVQIDEV